MNERADRRVNPRASRKVQIRGIFFRRPPSRHDSSSSSLPAFLLSPLLCPAGYIRTILLCSGYCICVCSAIPINTINWLKIPGNIYSFSNSFRFLFFKNSSSTRIVGAQVYGWSEVGKVTRLWQHFESMDGGSIRSGSILSPIAIGASRPRCVITARRIMDTMTV